MAVDDTNFSLGYKIWLEKDGGVLGDGFFQLLEHIRRTGSIAGAATAMGMSYRTAWGKIKMAEQKWGLSLVLTRVGGETGGGAELTPGAVHLLETFHNFRSEADREMNKIFKRYFKV